MNLPEYQDKSSFIWIALPCSLAFHGLLAWLLIQDHPKPEKPQEQWMEMVVQIPPEPIVEKVEEKVEEIPEPPPEKPPEVPPKTVVKKIDFADIPPEDAPPEEQPEKPPEEKKKVQRVQGLKANSFAEGANTGLSVRAGTTLQTGASDKTLSITEAKESTAISYAAATKQPRLQKRPPLSVPQSIIDENIEGSVEIVIDIGVDGRVTDARVVKSVHVDADNACLSSWKQAVFQPALQESTPIAVTNFPRKCRFESTDQ